MPKQDKIQHFVDNMDTVNLTISSVDVDEDGISVVFDAHDGIDVETVIRFRDRSIVIDVVNIDALIDGEYVRVDPILSSIDLESRMKKLFVDEYVFNNVVIQQIFKIAKIAVLLYKDMRYYVDIKNNLRITRIETLYGCDTVELNNDHRKVLDDAVREYINEFELNRMENVKVVILKMYEAAVDNTQYFVRIVRNDVISSCVLGSSSTLEYACFQTKHFDRDECLSRAWWMASSAAQFVGITSLDDIELQNFTDEEATQIRSEYFTVVLGV